MFAGALILGFAGSLHCVGMCSPLMISITSLHKHAIAHRFLYNIGRILTYATLGWLISIIGSLLIFEGLQTMVSIVLGLTLIALGIAEITSINIPVVSSGVTRFTGLIKSKYAKFLHRKSSLSMLAMGMLNGLLPCGLTYIALTYCLSMQKMYEGPVFMFLFGIGTLPAMIGGSSAIMFFVKRFSLNVGTLTMIAMICAGTMLLARPLLTHHHRPVPGNRIAPSDITTCGNGYKKI